MPRVEYVYENMEKCQCGSCPVYKPSQCIAQRNAAVDWKPGYLPPAEALEGLYCAEAVGKSKCNDLDSKQSCICPTCLVWSENQLISTYFCLRGPAM